MKRTVALLLAFLLVCPAAFADSVNLSSMSYDELIQLQQRLQAEIVSRPEWKTVAVPPGEYIVGVDIPAGSYSLSVENGTWGVVSVYSQAQTSLNIPRVLYTGTIGQSGNTIGRITLESGNIFKTTTTVVFSPVRGLGF